MTSGGGLKQGMDIGLSDSQTWFWLVLKALQDCRRGNLITGLTNVTVLVRDTLGTLRRKQFQASNFTVGRQWAGMQRIMVGTNKK